MESVGVLACALAVAEPQIDKLAATAQSVRRFQTF
jgi:hypothetical protein